jgi:hypothetical protein
VPPVGGGKLELLTLEEFARSFTEDVLADTEQADDGAIQENVFTRHAQEVITEAGEAVDPQLCQYRGRGVRLSGYDYLEDSDEIDLFVSDFDNSDKTRSIGATEVSDLLDRGRAFLGRSLDGAWQQWEESTEAHDLAELIYGQRDALQSARVILLTNRIAPRTTRPRNVTIAGIDVTHQVWDIERLYQVSATSLAQTPITVDLEGEFGGALPCITTPARNGIYDAYFAVIPAPALAAIYGRWGQRLLQRNVRSFLQARGSVNKGIRDTLDKSPEMFLAYNNGISATAASVTLTTIGDETRIQRIDNLQIVTVARRPPLCTTPSELRTISLKRSCR